MNKHDLPVDSIDEYWQLLLDGNDERSSSDEPSDSGEQQNELHHLLDELNQARLLLQADSTNWNGNDPTAAVERTAFRQLAGSDDIKLDVNGYDLLHEVGRGGMGVVFAARQATLNRDVALKIVRTGGLATPVDIARFQGEATAAASLSHPGIVPVFDFGETSDYQFLAMEYVEGPTLAEKLSQDLPDSRQAARWMQQISDAIEYAHQHKVLHRDLKPSNIILDASTSQPRITDFGLAKTQTGDSGLTRSGAMVGTPSYMSPEQAIGESKNVSPASDVYSLGAVLYEMLTGRPPFRAATPIETMRQVVDAEPAAVRSLNPSVPRDLEIICLKCLAKNPAARYASATALSQDLGRMLKGEPILARPIGPLRKLAKWCRRNTALSGTLAAAAILSVLGIGIHNTRMSRALAETRASRELAERDYERATAAVKSMLTTFASSDLADTPGAEDTRLKLLEQAADLEKQFLNDHRNDPRRIAETVIAERHLGQIQMQMGSLADAESTYNNAIERSKNHDGPRSWELNDAEAAVYGDLATCIYRQGRGADAVHIFEAVAERATEFADSDTEHRNAWKASEASNCTNVANVVFFQGQADKSIEMGSRAVPIFEELIVAEPDNIQHELNLAIAHNILGLAWQRNDDEKAKTHLLQSLEIRRRLADENPEKFDIKSRLAEALNNMAIFHKRFSQLDRTKALYAEAINVREQVAEDLESSIEDHKLLAQTICNSANVDYLEQNFDAALRKHERAEKIYRQLVDEHPEANHVKQDLSISLKGQGEIFDQMKDYQGALEVWEEAAMIRRQAAEQSPDDRNNDFELGNLNAYIGYAKYMTGEKSAGIAHMRETVDGLVEIIKDQHDPMAVMSFENATMTLLPCQWQEDPQAALDLLEEIAAGPLPDGLREYTAARLAGFAILSLSTDNELESLSPLQKFLVKKISAAAAAGHQPSFSIAQDQAFDAVRAQEEFQTAAARFN